MLARAGCHLSPFFSFALFCFFGLFFGLSFGLFFGLLCLFCLFFIGGFPIQTGSDCGGSRLPVILPWSRLNTGLRNWTAGSAGRWLLVSEPSSLLRDPEAEQGRSLLPLRLLRTLF